ncbi:MAG TPA: GPW/gp25 family protein [Acidimicrobiales bacterium]|nr:GPW/gp25 family protein [Acidimicrobiales bacterium]
MSVLPRQDIAYPFSVDPASQQTAQVPYPAHVDQMVRQLLLTSPGERVDLPQFGCGLRSLVFAPITDALTATVQLRVLQALGQWLSGIVIPNEVTVLTAGDSSDLAPGTLKVTVAYTVVDTQVPASTTVILQ